jgi:hypothetical protein
MVEGWRELLQETAHVVAFGGILIAPCRGLRLCYRRQCAFYFPSVSELLNYWAIDNILFLTSSLYFHFLYVSLRTVANKPNEWPVKTDRRHVAISVENWSLAFKL